MWNARMASSTRCSGMIWMACLPGGNSRARLVDWWINQADADCQRVRSRPLRLLARTGRGSGRSTTGLAEMPAAIRMHSQLDHRVANSERHLHVNRCIVGPKVGEEGCQPLALGSVVVM